ncbi:hypothetical protein SAMN05421503_2182 [Terribacillus aidingensis]|uniref:Bacterial Ig-like domain-containing protein n=1 Tax=Terribacillus aidingensis TaxID=586416 RepID=A0A285NWV5_9BACI|nr:immunoglobulin-like domain-containing protein [Terribacillus aidingensis]SNZ13974.1 hypothetical protein SAMN05421503_2182 [Terribacillus aidingensis]
MRRPFSLCMVLLFILTGCGYEPESSPYGKELKKISDNDVSLRIKENSLKTPGDLNFHIQNNGEETVAAGNEFAIEKYDEKREGWFQVPFKSGSAFTMEAMLIEPDSYGSFYVSFNDFDYRFSSGKYRIVKVFSSDTVLYDEFTLDK